MPGRLPNLTRSVLLLTGAGLLIGLIVALRQVSFSRKHALLNTAEGVFSSNNEQAIYASDAADPWNRIFHLLFTRKVSTAFSSDFPDAAPFTRGQAMGTPALRISTQSFERIETGDRAIDPLYPSFLTSAGTLQVLSEPRFSELRQALVEAIAEQNTRPPIARALMQSDVWAAYDILFSTGNRWTGNDQPLGERKAVLLSLFGRFIRKLALSQQELGSLESNYSAGQKAKGLPDLFSSGTGWIEIQLLPHRLHDDSARFRRAARVFVRPRQTPDDKAAFVESLKQYGHVEELEATALVVQNLLVDNSSRVVPSPIISDVQLRLFPDGPDGRGSLAARSGAREYELSRRLLLTDPKSGGFVEFLETAPSYVAASGNDYDFASPLLDTRSPLLAHLRTRCTQCHGPSLKTLMTYSLTYIEPVPHVSILNPANNDQALYVARLKEQRDDFKSLQQWR